MKKSTIGIIATVFALTPLTAVAQDAQTNIQSNTNSAAGVGEGNVILQNADQTSVQQQLDIDGDGIPDAPGTQTSVQGNANEAAGVGYGNVIGQDANQTNYQGQTGVDIPQPQYAPPEAGYPAAQPEYPPAH